MPPLPRLRQLALLLVHLHGPRGIRVHLRLRDARDLVAAPVRARHPRHAELPRQLTLHRRRGDTLQRAQDRAQARGIQRPPLPIPNGPGDPRDLIVNVILRVAVPAGALQPRRHDQARFLEPARLLPVHPDTVIPGPGDPGPFLQVLQRGPVGPVQDLLEPLLPSGPVGQRPAVSRQPRPARVFPDRGVQHRDRLGERDRDVGVGGGLPGRLRRLPLQLDHPLGSGMRLGGLQLGQVVGERRVAAARPAELGPGPRVALLVDGVIGLTFNDLPGCETECLRSGSPPPPGRFPGLGGVDVIAAGRAFGAGLPLGLPDVAEVVALGDGDDHGQPAASSFPSVTWPRS